MTQKDLATKVGVSRVSVTQWENDPTVQISGANLSKLCRALLTNADYLLEGRGSPDAVGEGQSKDVSPTPTASGMCPEISWVQAGNWQEVCFVDLDPESVNWYPRPPGASEQTYVLRVIGESMAPEYQPGTLIYVDPDRGAESGKDVIAVMTDTGEATFKRFIEEPGAGRMLKALNPSWRDPYLPINGNCKIIGVVVADMRMR